MKAKKALYPILSIVLILSVVFSTMVFSGIQASAELPAGGVPDGKGNLIYDMTPDSVVSPMNGATITPGEEFNTVSAVGRVWLQINNEFARLFGSVMPDDSRFAFEAEVRATTGTCTLGSKFKILNDAGVDKDLETTFDLTSDWMTIGKDATGDYIRFDMGGWWFSNGGTYYGVCGPTLDFLSGTAASYDIQSYKVVLIVPDPDPNPGYSVTAPEGITVSNADYVYEGEGVTLTLPSDPDKQLTPGSLSITYDDSGSSVTRIIITKADTSEQGLGSGLVYSFTMPAADVQVNAVLKARVDLAAEDNAAVLAAAVNTDLTGLRFLTRVYLTDGKLIVAGEQRTVLEVGTLILPTDMLSGELTVDTALVTKITATKMFDKTDKYIDITGGLKNIKAANLGRDFSSRGYIKYLDGSSVEQIAYTNTVSSDYNTIAQVS